MKFTTRTLQWQLVKSMLCSKLFCQKCFDLILFSHKLTPTTRSDLTQFINSIVFESQLPHKFINLTSSKLIVILFSHKMRGRGEPAGDRESHTRIRLQHHIRTQHREYTALYTYAASRVYSIIYVYIIESIQHHVRIQHRKYTASYMYTSSRVYSIIYIYSIINLHSIYIYVYSIERRLIMTARYVSSGSRLIMRLRGAGAGPHPLSLSLSLTHTHTHYLSFSLVRSLSHTLSLSLSLALSHTLFLSVSVSLALSLTHTHTLSLSRSLSLGRGSTAGDRKPHQRRRKNEACVQGYLAHKKQRVVRPGHRGTSLIRNSAWCEVCVQGHLAHKKQSLVRGLRTGAPRS